MLRSHWNEKLSIEMTPFISIFFLFTFANGQSEAGFSLSDVLIGFEFPQQLNGSADLLQIPVHTGETSQTGLSLCFRIKLKFWDLKCLFNTQSNISMAMPNYKRGFVR